MIWDNGQILMQDAECRMHGISTARMEKSIILLEIGMHALDAWHTLHNLARPLSYVTPEAP